LKSQVCNGAQSTTPLTRRLPVRFWGSEVPLPCPKRCHRVPARVRPCIDGTQTCHRQVESCAKHSGFVVAAAVPLQLPATASLEPCQPSKPDWALFRPMDRCGQQPEQTGGLCWLRLVRVPLYPTGIWTAQFLRMSDWSARAAHVLLTVGELCGWRDTRHLPLTPLVTRETGRGRTGGRHTISLLMEGASSNLLSNRSTH
jgi:hypothetical protein